MTAPEFAWRRCKAYPCVPETNHVIENDELQILAAADHDVDRRRRGFSG